MKYKLKSLRSPEEHAKYNEYRRKLRHKNIIKERERDRLRRAKKRQEQKELINEQQRKYYERDPDAARKQNERRQIREPNRLIRATCKLLEQGVIELDDAIKRCDRAVELSKQNTVSKRSAGRPKSIRVRAQGSENEHGNNGKTNAGKD